MNQYRCETCKHYEDDDEKCACNIREEWIPTDVWNWIKVVGCTSHSDFQSGWDTVLDAVFASMDTFFGNIPMDSHIIQWAISKQDSFVTAAMATYLESRKLRQAGEP